MFLKSGDVVVKAPVIPSISKKYLSCWNETSINLHSCFASGEALKVPEIPLMFVKFLALLKFKSSKLSKLKSSQFCFLIVAILFIDGSKFLLIKFVFNSMIFPLYCESSFLK